MVALLRAGAQITVLNVFTQSDYAVDLATVDSSLPVVQGVSRARRLEDERFVTDIASAAGRNAASIRLVDLEELDAPLRLAVQTERVLQSPLTADEVRLQAKQLAERISALVGDDDYVFAPLALGDHIDHRVVRESAKIAVPTDRLCLYEDLPYAARLAFSERKAQTKFATESNCGGELAGFTLRLQNGPHLKSRFAVHYPSQIAHEVAEEMARYAAEGCTGNAGAEHWWATASAGSRLAQSLQYAAAGGTLIEEQR